MVPLKLLIGALLLTVSFALVPVPCHSQNATAKRQVVHRVEPNYPQLARRAGVGGVVKVEALVAPDGTAKDVEVKGGHPVLVDAVVSAVRRWRWEPAAQESHELVQVTFSAQ